MSQTMAEVTRSANAGERRKKERIYIPFPAAVEGVDINGEEFNINTVLDNLSSNSLYLRLMPCVKPGSKIAVRFKLSTSGTEGRPVSSVSVRGTVIRSDEKPGGACGIAIKFKPPRQFVAV
jgi:hypothetical protein